MLWWLFFAQVLQITRIARQQGAHLVLNPLIERNLLRKKGDKRNSIVFEFVNWKQGIVDVTVDETVDETTFSWQSVIAHASMIFAMSHRDWKWQKNKWVSEEISEYFRLFWHDSRLYVMEKNMCVFTWKGSVRDFFSMMKDIKSGILHPAERITRWSKGADSNEAFDV